uniref:Reverse transcriptase domain-containing protein n=1 Tax=Pygocentrus nattereri TaxID=42514 RepID=A0AAR2LJE7_PYGNA
MTPLHLSPQRFYHHFHLQQGMRQGCPLSPLLFNIAIEPLALALRQDILIKGIYRGDQEHKLSHYADDLLLYISDPMASLPRLLELFDGKYKINPSF